MSEVRLSRFLNAKDGIAKPMTTTWPELAAAMGPHQFHFQSKEDLPAFSPAEFRPGMPRLARNVLRVWFGVLDLDKITAQTLAAIVQKLEGLDAIVYTTWSHPRYLLERGLWALRICVRLSRPIELQEWPSFWPLLLAYFGAPGDPQCKDPGRIYFGPFAPPGTEPRTCHYVTFQGQPLDVAALARNAALTAPVQASEKIGRDRLAGIAKNWKRSREEYRNHMGDILSRVVQGEPFAETGNRDNLLFQLCQDLVKAFPSGSAESLAAHFAQSLQVMGADAPPLEEVQRKLERAQEETAAENVAAEMAELSESKLRIREAFAHVTPDRDWPYTEEELDQIADKTRCTREELRKRWIIQRGTSFYLLGPAGVYSAAYTEKDVTTAVLRDLAPARSAGVELWTVGATGEPIRKQLGQLMGEYGSVAVIHVLDLRASEARYDNVTRSYLEAPCPVRKLEPVYDQEVAAWLHYMCGGQEHDVLNWIALMTDLDSTCAALMLTGPGDSGKGLLAHGLSRVWTTTQPTDLEQVLGDWNEALARCPLIFADEQIPKDFRGHGRTSELRALIGTKARPYRKKYAHDAVILGAVRLIIAANNENVLAFHENLTKDDIQAVADRIVHVPVQPAAVDYLRRIDAASFVNQERIARHALWLRDHYPIRREGRFLIRSRNLETIMALSTKGGIRSAVCQWLVGYLKAPARIDSFGDLKVRIKGGRLYVNTEGLLNNWDTYVGNEASPAAGKLAQAVSAMSEPDRVHMTRQKGPPLHYRAIITAHLYAWADQTEFASREEIDAALRTDTEARIQGGPLSHTLAPN